MLFGILGSFVITTNSQFSSIEIDVYERAFVLDPVKILLNLLFILWFARTLYMLSGIMITRREILAILFSIVIPVVFLVTSVGLYMYVKEKGCIDEMMSLTSSGLVIGWLSGGLVMLIAIEARFLKSVANLLWYKK